MANNEDIKEAALRLFAINGYEGTSMQDIAQAVGLKKQSLYAHISCKEELFQSVLRDQTKMIMSELDMTIERLKDDPPEVLLKGLFQSLITVLSCRERLLLWKRMFIYYGSNATTSVVSKLDLHFDKKIQDHLSHALQTKHSHFSQPAYFRSLFLSYMLTVQGYLEWMMVMGHQKEVFDTVWGNFWNGISPLFKI